MSDISVSTIYSRLVIVNRDAKGNAIVLWSGKNAQDFANEGDTMGRNLRVIQETETDETPTKTPQLTMGALAVTVAGLRAAEELMRDGGLRPLLVEFMPNTVKFLEPHAA